MTNRHQQILVAVLLLRLEEEGQTLAVILLQHSTWSAPHLFPPLTDDPEQHSLFLSGATEQGGTSQPPHRHTPPPSSSDASPETTVTKSCSYRLQNGFYFLHPSIPSA